MVHVLHPSDDVLKTAKSQSILQKNYCAILVDRADENCVLTKTFHFISGSQDQLPTNTNKCNYLDALFVVFNQLTWSFNE